MQTLIHDLRYAFRQLRRSPGFTAVAVLTLALGIGANTAVFSIFSAALLRPLPYSNPDRVVVLWETKRQYTGSYQSDRMTIAAANFSDWKHQNHVFKQMVLVDGARYNMTGAVTTEKVTALQVQAGFFNLLGSRPQVGRTFNSEEDKPGADRVAVLSAALWNRQFGRQTRLVGQTITLDGQIYTVIGVMPSDFVFPVAKFNLWVPLAMNPQRWAEGRDGHEYGVVARLRDGVSLKQAQTEMGSIAASLERQYPATNSGSGVRLVPIEEEIAGNVRPALTAILGAVGLLLLIVCSNVAMLLLARASGRRHEIAVRVALGANRRKLLAQLLTEGTVLAALGGTLGLALSSLAIPFLRVMPVDLPRLDQVSIDWRVLVFSLLVVILSTVTFALAPAVQLAHGPTASTLNSGTRSGLDAGDRRTGNTLRVLVVIEMMLAVVLMTGAGLLTRSLWKVMTVDPGFNPERLITADLSLAEEQHLNAQQELSFYGKLLDEVRSLPDVTSAGFTSNLPIGGSSWGIIFSVEGRPIAASDFQASDQRLVSPGYFETMGIPLASGRFFESHDTPGAQPVAIINDAFARRYFPGENPIGHRVKWGRPENKDLPWWFTIVGIVGSVRHRSLETSISPELYMCSAQMADPLPAAPAEMTLVVRSRGSLVPLSGALRNEVARLDSQAVVQNMRTMESVLSDSLTSRRFNVEIFGGFGGLALILAWIGIYGVVTYATARRTHEIGIRIALGASPGNVLGMVLGQSIRLICIGVALGVLGAWFAVSSISSLLYGVGPHSLPILAIAVLVVATAALAASYLPARRAAKVDPMIALRCE